MKASFALDSRVPTTQGGGGDFPARVQAPGQLHCGPAWHKLQSYIAGKLPIKNLAITLHSHVKFMFEWLKVAVLLPLPKYYFCSRVKHNNV